MVMVIIKLSPISSRMNSIECGQEHTWNNGVSEYVPIRVLYSIMFFAFGQKSFLRGRERGRMIFVDSAVMSFPEYFSKGWLI